MSDESERGRSRRTVLRVGLAALAVGTCRAASADEPQKVAKDIVGYQDHPSNGQQCSGCVHFRPPNACELVEGNISPNGWCGVFAAKQS